MIHQKQHFPFDRLFDGDSTERLFSSIAGCFPIRHKLALCRQSTGTVWHSENPTRLGLSPESRFSIVENEIYVSDQICAFADQIIFFSVVQNLRNRSTTQIVFTELKFSFFPIFAN